MMRKETIKGHTLPVLQCDKQYGGLLEQVSQYAFAYINTIYQKPPFPDEKAIQELNLSYEASPFRGLLFRGIRLLGGLRVLGLRRIAL